MDEARQSHERMLERWAADDRAWSDHLQVMLGCPHPHEVTAREIGLQLRRYYFNRHVWLPPW